MTTSEAIVSIGIPFVAFALGLAGGFWIQRHFTLHRLKISLRIVEHTANPPGSRLELRVKHRSGISLHRVAGSWGRNPRIDFAGYVVLDDATHPIYSVHPVHKCSVPLGPVNGGSSVWINLNYMDRRSIARVFFVATGAPAQLNRSAISFFPGTLPDSRVKTGGSLLPGRQRHFLSE